MNKSDSTDVIWRPVFGYESTYEVSSVGQIRSKKRTVSIGKNKREVGGNFVKPILGSRGYYVVNFTAGGKRRQHFLHKLVLESFIGPRPDGMDSCHNNGDRLDCSIKNLRWDTKSGNHKDKRKHGTWQVGEKANNSKLKEAVVLEIRRRGLTPAQAVKEFGLSSTNAKRVVSGETWWYLNEQQTVAG